MKFATQISPLLNLVKMCFPLMRRHLFNHLLLSVFQSPYTLHITSYKFSKDLCVQLPCTAVCQSIYMFVCLSIWLYFSLRKIWFLLFFNLLLTSLMLKLGKNIMQVVMMSVWSKEMDLYHAFPFLPWNWRHIQQTELLKWTKMLLHLVPTRLV